MNAGVYLRSFAGFREAGDIMREIGVCPEAVGIMEPKMQHIVFMVRGLDPRAANILKQEVLAVGGEAAISYHTLCDLSKPTDCLLSGTQRQLSIAGAKLAMQPFGLSALSRDLGMAVGNLTSPRARRFGTLEMGKHTLLMGILNVTPDSFSGDGVTDPKAAAERGISMARAGAHVIDVGGESTRPGAARPSAEEEMARVIPVIEALAGKLDIPISVDSRDPGVVEAALRAGAGIVNLVGGIRTGEMAEVLARTGAPVVLMHMQGEPGTMQAEPEYVDVMDDIVSELRLQIAMGLDAGMSLGNMAVDPGLGFGKTAGHNLEILRRLGEMRVLGLPMVVGASRKSFIGKVLGTEAGERLDGSLASAVLASACGADMVRVHDVAETAGTLKLADAALGRGIL